MNEIRELLKLRENQLIQWKKKTENSLKQSPDGTLRVCKHGNRTQYYHRTDPRDFNGTYIPQKNIGLAQSLAQKDYDKKLLCAIEKEMSAIKKYVATCPELDAEQVYDSLHPERRKLITPILEPDDDYIQKWKTLEYEGKAFNENIPELYTTNGERVRSKSEIIIADLLNKEGIPYRYEYPIYLNGIGRIYPDFTTLNIRTRKEILWEHLGMMDDPVYVEKAIKKIAMYEQNGFFPGENLILTYESLKNPINQKILLLMIDKYLK